ncbi:hypothetical protein LCGC14_0783920 [marine sediment metagenome]|uniref:Ribosomal RNA adenine methylase transferase N-terminal domain-containing protein n=1 Tax=marine sediment metagenome TaxID=412755 RepID=A0A0F9SEJ8_9ZZZZ|nr:ribosomal RNA small subunit methyltransferase A [bacterium]
MNIQEVNLVLNQLQLKPQKKFGQNFLTDNNVVQKMISLSEITKSDTVLEIGPGLGSLTEFLVKKAKKVYAIEIEPLFCAYLSKKLSVHNNIEIINDDVLKIDIPKHDKVVSNIPYTITGSIFEKVFFNGNPSSGILIIEKSIANRIFYTENYKTFSRISVSVNAFMKPLLKFEVSRNSFYPPPKIDLSLIKVIPKEDQNLFLTEENRIQFFLKFIAGLMPYKNKNILNALYLFFKANKVDKYSKERISQILKLKNYDSKKVFTFKIEEFIELSKLFYNEN